MEVIIEGGDGKDSGAAILKTPLGNTSALAHLPHYHGFPVRRNNGDIECIKFVSRWAHLAWRPGGVGSQPKQGPGIILDFRGGGLLGVHHPIVTLKPALPGYYHDKVPGPCPCVMLSNTANE